MKRFDRGGSRLDKGVLFLLLTISFVLSPITAMAESEEVDGVVWYYGTLQNWLGGQYVTYAYVTYGAAKYSGDLVIPSQLGGHPVMSIGDSAFSSCSGLTSVTIPDSVTSIGGFAFYGCTGLTSMMIPESVTRIGECAFQSCTGLTSLALPKSVTDIQGRLFQGCSGLTSVIIPDGVTSIWGYAFDGCSGLTSVEIPEGVTSIGDYAFQGCSGLVSVTIPASVTYIGSYAFKGCDKLMSFNVTDGNTAYKVESNCLVSINGLELVAVPFGCGTVEIPEGVSAIPNQMFYNMHLQSVSIPSSVTRIGDSAFYGCSELASVLIREGLTSIGDSAFRGCSRLTNVVIPKGVTSMGGHVFYGCSGLTSMAIPEGVTSLGGYVFYGCSGLTSMAIPEGVMSIGSYAFKGCSSLVSVTIPSSMMSISNYAFDGCSGLRRVNITDLKNWCAISFGGSSANPISCAQHLYLEGEEVKDLVIPSGLNDIGDYVFYCCAGLTSVTIPSSVTSIGSYAFSGCGSLTSATIPAGVKSIGSNAFAACSSLTSVTIPSSVTSIGASAFHNCSGIISVTIPEGVESIADGTFWGCSSLLELDIPSTVLSISRYAFVGCPLIRHLMIPASVVSISKSSTTHPLSPKWPKEIEFLGAPPSGIEDSGWLSCDSIRYSREYGAEWQKIIKAIKFAGFAQTARPEVSIVFSAIRENDPTVMDVVYKVKSAKPTVKVRALAFQDGERSFAKVVRPTQFIEETNKNIGDAIMANEEHKLSWRVSADWKVDLAKVKFEVLVVEDDLLPLELTTIPKVDGHAAMEISWNVMTEQQVFDALLWLYADGDEGIELADGMLKRASDSYLLGYGTTVSIWSGRYSKNVTGSGSAYYYFAPAIDYVYSKMGFSRLSGDELKYVNDMTRMELNPSEIRQYAWRIVEE